MSIGVQGLRVFLSILECESLSAAGRELGMTQPAVSGHLHSLEERFGLRLLTRGKSLRATPAGVCLAEHARRVLAELDALEEDMALQSRPRGRLLIGASSTPGEFLLPAVAVRFSVLYPEVAFDLHVADTGETIAALLKRSFEVAVVGREVDDPRLEGAVVEQDELVAVIAAPDRLADSEVSPATLAERPFVLRERGSATRWAVEKGLARSGIAPLRAALELGSNAAIARAVAAGTGIGVLPTRVLATYPEVKRLNVHGLEFLRPFVLVTERGRQLSPAAEAFVELCMGREAP